MISLEDFLSLLLGYTVSLCAYFLPSLLLSRRTIKVGPRTEPTGWMVLFSLLFACVAFATNFGTPISVIPSLKISSSPSSHTYQPTAKPYETFEDFYTRYKAEHQVPLDRTLHVALFTLTTASMLWEPRYLVTWLLSITSGALFTRPFLSNHLPWVESAVISSLAGTLAAYYHGGIGFLWRYSLWTGGDLLSHV